MNSVWQENYERKSFNVSGKNIKTDVLIIGGGLAGLLCAYMLCEAGVDCVLVEANRICEGVTKDSTAKITVGHGLIYDSLIKKYGTFKARQYLQAQVWATQKYSELCKSIECDYEKKDFFVYSVKNTENIEKEASALHRLSFDTDITDISELPLENAKAIKFKDQAQFNPLKFAFGISGGLPIYENTKVLELIPGKAITNRGEIRCKKIIVATHFPIFNKHGGYFLKMYQHRSYVLALKGTKTVSGMYVDEDDKGLSFRSYKNLLLLGGGAHRTGKQGGSFSELEEFTRIHYPEAKIVNMWGAQDCMTLDGIPYIGKYSKNTPDLYVATGFNKWGITNSMVSAKILTELICKGKSEFSGVFSPSRSVMHLQLATNIFESLAGFLTPTKPRCPHMGCALKYNPEEHSWDCPCHGSRFTVSGKLIDNPATDDKKGLI